MAQDPRYSLPTYTPTARGLHWLVALLVVIQIPIGVYMAYRGNEMPSVNEKGEPVIGVWDGITNTLYSSHKLLGLTILLIVVLRLAYRLTRGAPRSDPSVPAPLTGLAHFVHWGLYALLVATPILGYTAISYGDYLDVFSIKLPAITVKNEDLSKEVFGWHETAAMILVGFIVVHIFAAIYHRFVRRDRVVERMLPKRVV